MTWAIVTGEYPPQRGGVSDYTRLVAHALAACGDEVHVWAPESSAAALPDPTVQVHRLPGHFGPKALAMLDTALRRLPASARLLVQYVPHAYGWKAMNVPLCLWLAARPKQPLWVMYHEVAFPLSWSQPLKHNFLGLVTRGMAHIVARAAQRIFITIPAWRALLPQRPGIELLPVPSNIATSVSPEAAQAVRRRLAPAPDQILLGHFGSFSSHTEPSMADILPVVLDAAPNRVAVLVGKGGDRFVAGLLASHPRLEGRITGTGSLPGDDAAAHLAACDLLLQPYADGASGKRGSLMGGLALGLPIVSTHGQASEPFWIESGAVALAQEPGLASFLQTVEAVLADPAHRAELGRQAALLYEQHFSLAHTIRELRAS